MSQSSLEIDRELSSQERSYLDRPPSSRDEENVVMGKFRLTGFAIGLVIQVLSLLGVLWFLHAEESDWPDSFMGAFLCGMLAMVSWLALALCPVVWATPFILSMTSIGSNWVESLFSSRPSERAHFLSGVHFFFGLSTGSFISMISVDAVYGFPISVLRLLVGLVLCLGLCWAAVVLYDEEEKTWQQEQSTNTGIEMEASKSPRKDTRKNNNRGAPSGLLEPLLL